MTPTACVEDILHTRCHSDFTPVTLRATKETRTLRELRPLRSDWVNSSQICPGPTPAIRHAHWLLFLNKFVLEKLGSQQNLEEGVELSRIPTSPTCTASRTIDTPTGMGHLLTLIDPTGTHHCHLESRVDIRAHSRGHTIYGAGQMCGDLYPQTTVSPGPASRPYASSGHASFSICEL